MKIKKDIIARDIQGETVLLNLKSGDYFSLNSVGNDIYNCITQRMDEKAIVGFIVEKYDVDFPTANADVALLLLDLTENGILENIS